MTGASPAGETPPAEVENPFPGLRPFLEEEEHLFFGREHQVDAMVDRLAAARFLAVVGTSGSGKSSLVNCGLRPALHRGLMAAGGSAWRIAQFRPGGEPIQSMVSALSQQGVLFTDYQGAIPLQEIVDTHLRLSKRGLIDLFRKARFPEGTNLLIVVDQFEELFRYARLGAGAEAVPFVNLLLDTRQESSCPIYVVLTMRSDFLGDCSQFHGLPEAINAGQYLVPRMTRDERRAAIARPVGVGGAEIDAALLTRVVNDVGDNPDQLSILQHALNRTWANWAHQGQGIGPLETRHYEAIGTMAHALDQHAEKAYAELGTGRSQQVCEKIFKALTDKGTDARGIRRPTTFVNLCALAEAEPAEVAGVIEVFRKPSRSFLMPPVPTALQPNSIIDISHESLMRVWTRLNKWVDEEAESASQYRRLAESSALHAHGGAGLMTDPELSWMLKWRDRTRPNATWGSRYHPGFAESLVFLEESRKARESQRTRHRLKTLLWACGAVIIALSLIGIFWQEARTARSEQSARVRIALSAPDPLVGGLAVAELGYSAATSQPISALQQAATTAIPRAVLGEREPESPNPALIGAWFESGGKPIEKVVTVSVAGDLKRWPADGQGNPDAYRIPRAGDLTAVAVSRDRKWIACGFTGGQGWIARSDGSRPTPGLNVANTDISALAFSPDGEQILAGYTDYSVRIWTRDGTLLRVLGNSKAGHTGTITSVQIDSIGNRGLSASWDGTAIIWDLKTGKPLATLGGQSAVFAATFSPDVKWVLCGYENGLAQIWRSDGHGQSTMLVGHTKPVTSVAFSPDGAKALTGSQDLTARIWNVRVDHGGSAGTAEMPVAVESLIVLRGHKAAVRAVAFDADGSQAITASDDGTARVWWSESREPQILGKHEKAVKSIAFSPDGKKVVSSSDDKTARVWSLDGLTSPQVYKAYSYVRSAAFNSDGTKVVAGSEDGIFCVWDLASNTKVFFQGSDVLSIAFTPDGAGIITGTRAKTARVWSLDAAQREPLLNIEGHTDWVFHAAFNPDRSRIVTSSADHTARIWSVERDAKAWRVKGDPVVLQHPDRVLNAAFSPDGSSVATACADGRARIWNLNSLTSPPREFQHTADVFSVAFSSDQKWLLTASKDKTAQIWDIKADEPDLVLSGPAEVRAAAFGPGDSSVVTGAEDGFLRLWRITARDLVEYLGKASTACLTPHERVRFLGESPKTARSSFEGCEAAHHRKASAPSGTSTR